MTTWHLPEEESEELQWQVSKQVYKKKQQFQPGEEFSSDHTPKGSQGLSQIIVVEPLPHCQNNMSDPVPTTELKTYSGNCHCGAFKFHIRVPEITSVLDCDCSICFKKGYKWVFPGEGGFVVDKGEGTLKGYEFNHHIMSHQFCQNCGTSVLGKRKGMPPSQTYAVNVSFDVFLQAYQSNTMCRFGHFKMLTCGR